MDRAKDSNCRGRADRVACAKCQQYCWLRRDGSMVRGPVGRMHKRPTWECNDWHQLYCAERTSVGKCHLLRGCAVLRALLLCFSVLPFCSPGDHMAPHIAVYDSGLQPPMHDAISWIMFTYFLNLSSYSEPQACITVRPCTSQTLDQSGPGSLLDLGPARPGAHIEAPTTYLILKLRNFSPLRRFFETDSHSRKKQLNIQNPLWWSELNSELFDF